MKEYLLIISCLLLPVVFFSQDNTSDFKKRYNNAVKDFDEERFEAALAEFIRLDSIKPDDFEIKYYIGASYLSTKYDKVKGIPFLEFAGQKGEKFLPKDVFKDLGTLYHLNYEFDKAIYQFEKYLSLTDKTDPDYDYLKHMIQVCNNAKIALMNTNPAGITNLEKPLNSDQSERNPHVSADEAVMYFTREYVVPGDLIVKDSVSEILTSARENDIWSEPKHLTIEIDKNTDYVSIAGISPDGDQLYILLSDSNQTDIYTCFLSGRHCKSPVKLNKNINSPYNESGCSITPDGRILYFSSSRPGGLGGKDLYMAVRGTNEDWGEAKNLGPSVNTGYDEDAPFIHPDMQTVYFSSSGHTTIGGYDIFKSSFDHKINDWSAPVNLGYPINTTGDDINFVLSADGKFGYFSSNQSSRYKTHDIFKIKLERSIPLTMVKGIITTGNPPVPLKAQIKVFDVEKNERVKYIYNPNPESGKYLMIFPPGKNYNMLIEAENYLPHLLNIYIPEQNFFYELYQEINLTPIALNDSGKVLGEQISVKNLFYDLYSAPDTSVGENKDSVFVKDYSKMLKLIEELIQKSDSIGLEKMDLYSRGIYDESSHLNIAVDKDYQKLLEKIQIAIETSDSLSLEKLSSETLMSEKVYREYIYNTGSSEDSLYTFIIGKDTITALAPLKMSSGNGSGNNNNAKSAEIVKIKNSVEEERFYIFKTEVFYSSGSYNITEKYHEKLNDIAGLLIDNIKLGVEVKGFSDTSGDSENNKKLSEMRAKALKTYFVNANVNNQKILIKAYGESVAKTENSEAEKQFNRRCEIHVFTVKE